MELKTILADLRSDTVSQEAVDAAANLLEAHAEEMQDKDKQIARLEKTASEDNIAIIAEQLIGRGWANADGSFKLEADISKQVRKAQVNGMLSTLNNVQAIQVDLMAAVDTKTSQLVEASKASTQKLLKAVNSDDEKAAIQAEGDEEIAGIRASGESEKQTLTELFDRCSEKVRENVSRFGAQ